MTTDSVNSERERAERRDDLIDLLRHWGETWSEQDDCDAAADMLKSDAAELTSLRACVSRKDDEIEVWRTCLAEIQQDGCGPEESMEDLWGRTLDRIQSAAIAAANATQPSGRCAEGREEA